MLKVQVVVKENVVLGIHVFSCNEESSKTDKSQLELKSDRYGVLDMRHRCDCCTDCSNTIIFHFVTFRRVKVIIKYRPATSNCTHISVPVCYVSSLQGCTQDRDPQLPRHQLTPRHQYVSRLQDHNAAVTLAMLVSGY